VYHKNTRYNCRILFLNGRILLIRPKLHLANSGNYRESRWFSCWQRRHYIESHPLPTALLLISGQSSVPIGDAYLKTLDTSIGCEVCEELFTADGPHVALGLDGVEIFSNGSASHYESGKGAIRRTLVNGATARTGGVYLYANQHGVDGEGTLYYDGGSIISVNGSLVASTRAFPLNDVLVSVAEVDLEDVRVFRGKTQSLGNQGAASSHAFPQVAVMFSLAQERLIGDGTRVSEGFHDTLTEIEEFPLVASAWLWDYLRKSGASGFFLALSGGLDSAACALCVYEVANRICRESVDDDEVAEQVEQVLGISPSDLTLDAAMRMLLHTAYMSTSNSSQDSASRATNLATAITSSHLSLPLDTAISACSSLASTCLSFIPRFASAGGTASESLAMQNLQARLRMVMSYFLAQLLPSASRKTSISSFLLVMGTGNVDEGLRGYFSKYDSSSGDLNPIASLNKGDLMAFAGYMAVVYPELAGPLARILEAHPSAELLPGGSQTDEEDMGLRYTDLQTFGSLRSSLKSGPYSMFTKLATLWSPSVSLPEIATRVKTFFSLYAGNRHKMMTMTVGMHARGYNVEAHRFDQRPFLYRRGWPWQFARIDESINSDKSV